MATHRDLRERDQGPGVGKSTQRATPEFFARHSVAELAASLTTGCRSRAVSPIHCGTTRVRIIMWLSGGTSLCTDRIGVARSVGSRRGGVLYFGPVQQRGCVPLPIVRAGIGTNNFPDCSNFCHEPTSKGLPPRIGVGKGTCTLGLRVRRCDFRLRAKYGNQRPPDDDRAPPCGVACARDRHVESVARARARAFSASAERGRWRRCVRRRSLRTTTR